MRKPNIPANAKSEVVHVRVEAGISLAIARVAKSKRVTKSHAIRMLLEEALRAHEDVHGIKLGW
jgi:hypothetical protein